MTCKDCIHFTECESLAMSSFDHSHKMWMIDFWGNAHERCEWFKETSAKKSEWGVAQAVCQETTEFVKTPVRKRHAPSAVLILSKVKDDGRINMKKIVVIMLALVMVLCCSGCSQAERVSYNLSKQADNFNIVRQLTVINCIEGDVLFQMTGRLSITADTTDNQLEIIVEDNGTYVKHFVGLSDNVTYVVEDLNLGANAVAKYRYTLNFNPNMWIPVNIETIE